MLYGDRPLSATIFVLGTVSPQQRKRQTEIPLLYCHGSHEEVVIMMNTLTLAKTLKSIMVVVVVVVLVVLVVVVVVEVVVVVVVVVGMMMLILTVMQARC